MVTDWVTPTICMERLEIRLNASQYATLGGYTSQGVLKSSCQPSPGTTNGKHSAKPVLSFADGVFLKLEFHHVSENE